MVGGMDGDADEGCIGGVGGMTAQDAADAPRETDETNETHGERKDPRALLDAWKASGADRVDAMRFAMMEAFARRAAEREGRARRVLDDRLAALVAAYAGDVERTAAADANAATVTASPEAARARSPLAALNDHLARHAPPRRASWPELELLDEFRNTWSRISTDARFRQARERVPTNAGPLNSSSLVHRALSLMREQSPAYLQHFLSYVDALSWIEQTSGGEAPKDTRRATGAKKGATKTAKGRSSR